MRSISSIPLTALLAASLLTTISCGPKKDDTVPPGNPDGVQPDPQPQGSTKAEETTAEETAEAEPEEAAEAEAPAEPAEPAAKVPEGSIAIGMLNVEWGYDSIDEKRPKKAQPHVPKDEDAWTWKRERIAEILAAERLDVVVLTELGGERELSDIMTEVTVKNGPDYQYSWIESEDRFSGQQVGILSRFPVEGEMRDEEASVSKHLITDIMMPGDQMVTVIAVHFKEGKFKGSVEGRQREARAIKRFVRKQRRKNPVVVVGTVGSPVLPDDEGYKDSAPGTLASRGCIDSATKSSARKTTVEGQALDRIVVCDLEMVSAESSARDQIVRGDVDPGDPWPTIKVDDGAKRDVSDHLVLWAEIALPKAKG